MKVCGVLRYLGNRSGKDDNFIKFAYALHELIHARSLDHVDIMILSLDLDGNSEIRLVQNLYFVLAPKVMSRLK